MESNAPLVVKTYAPETHPRRVLLCNPPVYDTRFPWARFQQPVALLQLSSLLRQHGCEVRLFDALALEGSTSHRRRRMRIIERDGIPLNWWRFGRLPTDLRSSLIALQREKWLPDEVYIAGFATFWWEGVVELVGMVRHRFPHARIVLFGAYPSLATEQAARYSGADVLVRGSIAGVAGQHVDLSLAPSVPAFTYLSVGTEQRPVRDLTDEFLAKANSRRQGERVSQMAFADHDVVRRFPDHFRAVLQASLDHKCQVSFFALGNITPRDLVNDPELASLLKRAGYKQLVFADDRHRPQGADARAQLLDDYARAVEVCAAAGYLRRTESLVASVSLGRPGEDPGGMVGFITQLAHVAGSLMVVPYQPDPSECPPSLPLEMQNGKLFPFAEENGLGFRGYQDILGLAALFNAKYRNHTFDFLGDGLISRLVRESLATQSWDPRRTPGFDRPITVGWFNKEGKWVRS